jgi:hypothetical protein
VVNHVPNEALAALDEFGRGHLEGRTVRVTERLRSDLRLVVEPVGDDAQAVAETATCRFLTRHTQRPPRLRDRGSYVRTIVDGVDARLVAWGIEPPSAYEYADTDGDWHRYEGRLRLP